MLDERVLAVVRAIGADIKALLLRTTPIIGRTAAAQPVTSTTLVNITGLATAVNTSGLYRITGRIVFQASGLTVGASIGFVSPAGSVGQFIIAVPSTALVSTGTATVRTNGSSGSGSTSSVAVIATNMVATIDGLITVGATSGSFALQAAASGVGIITIQPGSMLMVERLA